ncbi:TnsD family Tn7-like transposition protein [Cupriavidus basilensis]|uniref:TnsD family Tn7-like transposition protein n=1 Tax=Cupriavidus basilensis TaxID=68895 RepID=UPI00157A475A|nr:TnsD family Tn7-like transposition protein [Cupriavidus basilensis]NUA30267.1 hypothetical protein [Cupriavidus basilensis]
MTGTLVTERLHPGKAKSAGWGLKGVARSMPIDGRHRYVLTPYAMSGLLTLVDAGCTCEEMARLCRTSLNRIEYYVRTRGLRERLARAQFMRWRQEARDAWLAVLRRRPDASQNQLALYEPRAYKWLWRHDRTWLAVHRPRHYLRRHRTRHDHVGPRGQDVSLAAQIRHAATLIKAVAPPVRCSTAAIGRQLGLSAYALARAKAGKAVTKALADVVELPQGFHDRVRMARAA